MQILQPFGLEGLQILLPDRIVRVGLDQAPQRVDAMLERPAHQSEQAMLAEQFGERLLDRIGLVEIGRHVVQKRRGRRDSVELGDFLPLPPLGKIECRHHVEQDRLDIGKLDRLAPQPLPQQRPAPPQPLVDLVAGHRIIGRRGAQEIHALHAIGKHGTSHVVNDSLVVEHVGESRCLISQAR